MSLKPLEGVRVFELSIAAAGPICGRTLAHFGAEVVKIESRKNPDVIRLLGSSWLPKDRFGPEVWADCGPLVSEFMSGKRSLGLDLKNPAAKEVVRRLLAVCDVFISNYSAPAVKRLGLDYESVRTIRPDVVYAAISGFGTDPATPYYDFVAWGPNHAPLIGLDDVTGWRDRPPSGFSVFAYPDFSNGLHAAVAVLAAIRHRDRVGRGQFIELSQLEATASSLAPWILDATLGGAPKRDGNRMPGAAPHGIYPSRGVEQWVAIAVFSDDEWRALCDAAGKPGWCDDPRFRTLESRLANQDALDDAIAEWTRERSDEEVAERLQRAGVAAAPVLDPPRVVTDVQLRERSFWMLGRNARLGRDLVTGSPIELSSTPGGIDRVGLSFGEDNDHILREICRFSTAEIESLVASGVVEPMARPGEVSLSRPYFSWIAPFLPQLPWQAAETAAEAPKRDPESAKRSPDRDELEASPVALAGVTVLDLTDGAFAYAPRLLADLGAEVIRIEPPEGSALRRQPSAHALFAANRKSRRIALTLPEGRAELAALAAGADVVFESGAPDRLATLGVGWESLGPSNPRLVWVAITPFGRRGPRRNWKYSNLVSWAVSGGLHAIGDRDRAPLAPAAPVALADVLAAVQAAIGAIVALRARDASGRGQLVDVSVHATTVAATTEIGMTVFLDDLIVRRRAGNRRRQLAPSGLFRCSDGYASIVVFPVAHWKAMAAWIVEKTGNEAALDPAFHDLGTRYETAELLEEWVESVTRLYTKQELFEEGQRRGIAIAPVNTLADLSRDPHLAARRWWIELDDPVLGKRSVAGAPYRLSATPWRTSPAPP